MRQIERLTLRDYQLAREAFLIQKAEQTQNLYSLAWLEQVVQSVDNPKSKNPKPKYEKFKDFFDMDEEIDDIRSRFEPGFVSKRQKEIRQEEQIKDRWKKWQAMKERKEVKKHG